MSIRDSTGGEPVAFYSERLEADLQQFEREQRKAGRRLWPCALLGAVLVVAFGIWGFGEETNTRNAVIHLAPPLPPGSAITVAVQPR